MQDSSFSSRLGFQAAVRQFAEAAAHQGLRELQLMDPDFADWPLGERMVVEHLTRWGQQHARPTLTLVAHHFDVLQTRQPRFATWRRQWAHLVHCKTPVPALPTPLPTLLIAPGCAVIRLFDLRIFHGTLSTQAADMQHATEQFDAILQRSVDTFPASVLGL
jgi:hypothetical protein